MPTFQIPQFFVKYFQNFSKFLTKSSESNIKVFESLIFQIFQFSVKYYQNLSQILPKITPKLLSRQFSKFLTFLVNILTIPQNFPQNPPKLTPKFACFPNSSVFCWVSKFIPKFSESNTPKLLSPLFSKFLSFLLNILRIFQNFAQNLPKVTP